MLTYSLLMEMVCFLLIPFSKHPVMAYMMAIAQGLGHLPSNVQCTIEWLFVLCEILFPETSQSCLGHMLVDLAIASIQLGLPVSPDLEVIGCRTSTGAGKVEAGMDWKRIRAGLGQAWSGTGLDLSDSCAFWILSLHPFLAKTRPQKALQTYASPVCNDRKTHKTSTPTVLAPIQ